MSDNQEIHDLPEAVLVRSKPDKRKQTSALNAKKAREARLEKIKVMKTTDEYEVEEQSSEDSDSETELVITRKSKPKVVGGDEARLLKIELQLQQIALQQKEKDRKKKHYVEKQVKKLSDMKDVAHAAARETAAIKQPTSEASEQYRKRLLDL